MSASSRSRKPCLGCVQNTQRIMVLENRIAFLEQNMMTRSSTPIRRGRSRSKKAKVRDKTPKPPPLNTSPQVHELSQKVANIQVSRLPEFIPAPVTPRTSSLDPVAPVFEPRYYGYPSQGQIGPEGGSGGYQ